MRRPTLVALAILSLSLSTLPAEARSHRNVASTSSHSGGPVLGIGGPFAIVSGHFGFGFLGQILFPIKVQGLWIGGQLGFYHWGNGSTTVTSGAGTAVTSSADSSANSFPILGTALFHLPSNAQFIPSGDVYIGGSMGFSITSYSASATVGGTSFSSSTSSTDFVFLVRPGVQFGGDNGHLFYVEPTFGTIASSFIFAPTFGVNIPL